MAAYTTADLHKIVATVIGQDLALQETDHAVEEGAGPTPNGDGGFHITIDSPGRERDRGHAWPRAEYLRVGYRLSIQVSRKLVGMVSDHADTNAQLAADAESIIRRIVGDGWPTEYCDIGRVYVDNIIERRRPRGWLSRRVRFDLDADFSLRRDGT